MTLKLPTHHEDTLPQDHSGAISFDSEPAEVWATVDSRAGRHYEGIGVQPGEQDPEFVLPYSDPERLGALLARLTPRLTAVALRLTRDAETAEDVVQTAFEKVLRNGHRYRGDAKVSTWIHRIVVNEGLMWLRSQKRRARVITVDSEATPAVDEGPLSSDLLDQRRESARLHHGLAQLPPEDRELLERCALAGVSYAEYAQRTGTHPAAVKSRAHRARRRLRSYLEVEPARSSHA